MTSTNNSGSLSQKGGVSEKEITVLVRSVEKVFRKLIRLLIGSISLKRLQEMIQIIFVEEAEKKLKQEAPGKNIPMSTLAVVSGLDTRTITRTRANENYMKPFHKAERFLNSITPECSILDVWESNPKYMDVETGEPRVLEIRGAEISFESLVNESGLTRGVSVATFLNRLEGSNSVVVDPVEGSVRMVNKRYIPDASENQGESIKVGMAAVSNLLDTVYHNVTTSRENGETFYQQGSWTNRLNKSESGKFRELLRKFLKDSDDRAREIIRPFEEDAVNDNQVTAGLSMFYFEEEPQS